MWYLVLDDIVYAHQLSYLQFDSALFFLSIFLKSDISPQRSDLEWGKNETDEWDPIRCKCHSIIEFFTPALVYKKSECQWNCVACLGVCMYLIFVRVYFIIQPSLLSLLYEYAGKRGNDCTFIFFIKKYCHCCCCCNCTDTVITSKRELTQL